MTKVTFSALKCEILEDHIARLREKIKAELSETQGFILNHSDGGKVSIQKRNITDWKETFNNNIEKIQIRYSLGEVCSTVETFPVENVEQAVNLFIGLGFKLIPLPVKLSSNGLSQGEKAPNNTKVIQELECGYHYSNSDETFGSWILNTFYKDVVFDDPTIHRDFRNAPRTVDAKIYLYGFLLTGQMNIEDFFLKKKHQ